MDRFSTVYQLRLRHDPRFTCAIGEGDELSIGRDPGNGLQFAHGSIAPFHCRLRNERGALKLEPLGRATVLVDQRRIRGPIELSGRESVRLGDIDLSFERELTELAPRASDVQHSSPARRWRRLMRYPAWILLSLGVHALLLLSLRAWSVGPDLTAGNDAPIVTTFSLRVTSEPPVEPLPEPELKAATAAVAELPSLTQTELPSEPTELWDAPPVAEPELADSMPTGSGDTAPGRFAFDRGGVIGLGGGGLGSGGHGSRAGKPARRGGIGVATPLGRFLEGVRAEGMDVAFVIDTTISMDSILGRAKVTLDRMVHLLQDLVPDLRLGVVAYRDRDDRYVVNSVPLDHNVYRSLCCILDLEAAGGGDFEEAVEQALTAATKTLEWRPRARRVILLIADAPPHAQDASEVLRQVAAFSCPPTPSRGEGVVAAMFTVSQDHITQERRPKIAEFFRAVARAGRGDFMELDQGDPLGQELLVLALGEQFRSELIAWSENRLTTDLDTRVIARHRERGDRQWFLRLLGRPPVHAGVVEALLDWQDRATLEKVAQIALSPAKDPECRFAALYVLKRALPGKITFDPLQHASRQQSAIDQLREAIGRQR